MATGLGAFTEGLQGGMEARRKHDISREYKRILSDKADRTDWQWDADVAAAKGKWETDPANVGMEFQAPQRSTIKDPALMRMFKFVGGRIKGAFGSDQAAAEADFATPAIQPSSPVQQGGGGMASRQGIAEQGDYYADGGRVEDEDEIIQEGWGRNPATETLRAIPGKAINAAGDVAERAGDTFYNTKRAWKEAGGLSGISREHMAEEGITAGERGNRLRSYMGDTLGGVAKMGVAVADDLLGPIDEGLGALGRGAWGFVGGDGGGDAAGIPAEAPATEDPATTQAVETAIDAPDKTDGQIAEEAMSEGQQSALENMDYKLLVDQGVSPEELPSMATREWADYRQGLFEREISRGVSAKEALQSVEFATVEVQMRGMQRELDKAVLYLGTGQNQEAAMAVRQGFQYFPNGVSVKFGTMKDPKTGLPVIMAMGTDEETGEPTGAPMIITADRLATMRAQMSDPKAFSAWTKDGHDLQVAVAKLEETEKHHTAMEDIYATNAATSRARAAAGQGGGMTLGEDRQRAKVFADRLQEDLELMDATADKESLSSAMMIYARASGITDQNTVYYKVMEAYRADPEQGVQALLQSVQQDTGIPEG